MIEDPIQVHSIEHWQIIKRLNLGKKVFSYYAGSLSLVYFGNSVYQSFLIRETTDPTSRFRIFERPATREAFILHMSKEFSEYFEWLLFHPEWLE